MPLESETYGPKMYVYMQSSKPTTQQIQSIAAALSKASDGAGGVLLVLPPDGRLEELSYGELVGLRSRIDEILEDLCRP